MFEQYFARGRAGGPPFRHFPRFAGLAVALFGLLIIASWYLRWRVVLQMLPNSAPMQYNTALCFILCGAGLYFLTTPRDRLAAWLGGAAAVFTLLTLSQYVSGRNLGIDEFFFQPYFEVNRIYAGRMSPLTAVCFVLLGSGIVTAGARNRGPERLAGTGMLAGIVGMIACVALFGFVFGFEAAYGWGSYTRMAVNSVVTLILLSGGLLVWSVRAARRENFNFLRWLPVTCSVTLMAMIGVTTAVSMAQLKEALFWRAHTYQVLITAGSFMGSITDAQRGMRGYVLTTSPELLELYRNATNRAPGELAGLVGLTHDNPAQQQRLKRLADDLEAIADYSRRLIAARDRQGLPAAVQLEKTGTGLAVMNQARADSDAFTREEQRLLAQRDTEASADYGKTARLLVFGSVLAAVLLVLANLMASREVRRRRQSEEVQLELNAQLAKTTTLQNAILSSANYAIISTSVDGVVTTFNSTAESWLGYSTAEVAGKLTPAIWHDAAEVAARAEELSRELGRRVTPGFEAFTAKARRGQADENEWTLIRKNGERFPATLSATALMDGAGFITGFLGVIADITERKRAESALKESEQKYRTLFESILEGYAYCRLVFEREQPRDFILVEVNTAFETLTGLKNVAGKKINEVLPGIRETNPELFETYSRAAATGKPYQFESYVEALGKWFAVSIYSHEKDHFVAVLDDITMRKKHAAEREKLISELQTALAEVKTLSGMIPICGWCKKVRADEGYWQSVEQFVRSKTHATFSHGMCPDCSANFKRDILKANASPSQ